MIEIIKTIAILCQVSGGSLEYNNLTQKNCQKAYLKCLNINENNNTSYFRLALKLENCVSKRK